MVREAYDKDTGYAIISFKHLKGTEIWGLMHFERYCQENTFTTICGHQKLLICATITKLFQMD